MTLNLPDPQEIPAENIGSALAQVAAYQSQLAARLITTPPPTPPAEGQRVEEPDQMLTVKEAAAALGVEKDWLYQRVKTLPFVRKISRKCIRFSKRGLIAWRDRRRP